MQAAVEAYLPVARAVVAEQDASQAQAAVPGLVADSQSAFLEALQQPTADRLVQLAMGLGNVRATIQALGEAQAGWIRQNRRHGSSLMRHGTN